MNESFRYKILRNGVEFAEIFAASAPTLRMQSTGEIKVSLQGEFLDKAVDAHGKPVEVKWLTDEIQPIMYRDGEEHPLGVLVPTTVTPTRSNGQKTLSIQAYDRCWKVKDSKVEGFIYLAAGGLYTDAIEGLLTSSGIATVLKTKSTETLAEERSDWSTGETYLKVINDLLSEINYNQLWFDQKGAAILRPITEPTANNINHTFSSKKTDSRIAQEAKIISITPKITRTMDIYNAPNVFVCVCSNPDKADVMIAKAENTNLQSPLSIPRRGRRIVETVNINNIASQSELQKYADTLRNRSMYIGEVIQVETALLPDFGVNDITAINDEDVFGICTETAWEMHLQPGGRMSHTLERTVINLE